MLAVVLWWLLYHTRWGIVLRACGESPAAADAAGVSVSRVRYLAVILGGALAGVAGGYLSVAYRPSWTEGMAAGMGWIALAMTIFAAWDPLKAVGAAVAFGACYHLAFRWQTWVAPELLKLLPYALTLVVLALTAWVRPHRWRGAAEALGLPYVRGER
jgi:simple sugar transport system permease protein